MRKIRRKSEDMFFLYVKDFFDHMRSELHSERTVETYRQSDEKYPYVRVVGKGDRPRIIPLPDEAFLDNYRYYRKLYHAHSDPESYLFYPASRGSHEMMSDDNVQRILKKYGDMARASNPNLPAIHPHLFRHSYAAQLYRQGVSLAEIAKLLGHENLSTTEIYAETDPEMASGAISKMVGKQPVRKWDSLTEDEKLKLLGLK